MCLCFLFSLFVACFSYQKHLRHQLHLNSCWKHDNPYLLNLCSYCSFINWLSAMHAGEMYRAFFFFNKKGYWYWILSLQRRPVGSFEPPVPMFFSACSQCHQLDFSWICNAQGCFTAKWQKEGTVLPAETEMKLFRICSKGCTKWEVEEIIKNTGHIKYKKQNKYTRRDAR